MKKHSVIIVDDHSLMAQALAGLVNEFDEYKVLDTFKNGAELIAGFNAGTKDPEIILLDVKMPIMDGFKTMEWLHNHKPNIQVIVISMEDQENTVLKMLKLGAKGFLLKDTEPHILESALDTVLKNGFFHTQLVADALLHQSQNGNDKKEIKLKETELEFLKLVCQEKTYNEIADIMYKHPKTIDGYRQDLFEKLGVRNRIGLVLYAIKNDLVKI